MHRDGDAIVLSIDDRSGSASARMNTRQIVKLCDDLLRTVLNRPDDEEDQSPTIRNTPEPGDTRTNQPPDQTPAADAPKTPPARHPVMTPPAAPKTGGVDWPTAWNHVPDPDEVNITPTARRYAAEFGFTDAQVIEAASNPASINKLSGGDWGHHRGRVLAVMAADDRRIVKGVMVDLNAVPEPGRSTAASGGTGRAWPSSSADLQKLLRAHGFRIHASTRQHPKISHPSRPGVRRAIPGSPSDHRSYMNLVAQIRKEFGIDITTSVVS